MWVDSFVSTAQCRKTSMLTSNGAAGRIRSSNGTRKRLEEDYSEPRGHLTIPAVAPQSTPGFWMAFRDSLLGKRSIYEFSGHSTRWDFHKAMHKHSPARLALRLQRSSIHHDRLGNIAPAALCKIPSTGAAGRGRARNGQHQGSTH